MSIKKGCFLITLFLLLGLANTKAQNNKHTDPKQLEREKISDLFYKAMSRDNFRDTNMIYMFSYKVEVRKNANGKARIWHVSASDTVAKKVFKDLEFLQKINYGLFMGKSTRSTFVFPVMILLEYPQKEHAGFVSQRTLVDKMKDYWFAGKYEEEPIETYLYFPAIVVRTSTVEDY